MGLLRKHLVESGTMTKECVIKVLNQVT